MDADEIIPNLWVGAVPPRGKALAKQEFDVLVLSAYDFQFENKPLYFENIHVLRAPLVDHPTLPLSQDDIELATNTANEVARFLKKGKKVLISCGSGQNRSAFICGIVLHTIKGWGGATIISHIKDRRQFALSSKQYVDYLLGLQPLNK